MISIKRELEDHELSEPPRKKIKNVGNQMNQFPTVKTSPITIKDLPDDVLLIIFGKLGLILKRDSEETSGTHHSKLDNLTLTCKRWNSLVEEYHIFGRNTFFGENRVLEDYFTLLRSTRKYSSLSFTSTENDKEQQLYLKLFLKNQPKITDAKIIVESYEDDMISGSQLELIPENFENFQALRNTSHLFVWFNNL